MDLKQLNYFTAVVDTGSISAAARKCGVSQPTLSQVVKLLEDDLGEPLLLRQARGVKPTTAGELLYGHAVRLLQEEAHMRASFSQRGELQSGRLAFGIIPTMAPYLLPRILAPFRTLYPGVQISIKEAKTRDLTAAVANGELDFAILSDVELEENQRWNLEVLTLFQEELMLALPKAHELALRPTVPLPAEIPSQELIHLQEGHCLTDQTLELCKVVERNRGLECDQLSTVLAMVGAGMGIAIVPAFATRRLSDPGLMVRSFGDPEPSRVISLMTLKHGRLSAPARALVDSLERVFAAREV